MTTCYSDDVLYIHIPKTAGCSVGGQVDTEGNWRGGYLPTCVPGMIRDGLPVGHVPVRAIPSTTGRPLESFRLILATIRNPFEQQVSQYAFYRRRGLDPNLTDYPPESLAASVPFSEFVKHPWADGAYFLSGMGDVRQAGGLYRWWISNTSGTIPANVRVVKVEELETALPEVTSPYRIRDAEIPRLNTGNRRKDWREYYDEASIQTVAGKFAWAFALHYAEELTNLRESLRI